MNGRRRYAPMGLWTLPGLPDMWTRKRTRAHKSLDAGKRPPASTAPWKASQTDGCLSTSAHRPRPLLVSIRSEEG
jgi:hypothetical protein